MGRLPRMHGEPMIITFDVALISVNMVQNMRENLSITDQAALEVAKRRSNICMHGWG